LVVRLVLDHEKLIAIERIHQSFHRNDEGGVPYCVDPYPIAGPGFLSASEARHVDLRERGPPIRTYDPHNDLVGTRFLQARERIFSIPAYLVRQ
jgi:hypothetical protein